jgi:hypothetical protein
MQEQLQQLDAIQIGSMNVQLNYSGSPSFASILSQNEQVYMSLSNVESVLLKTKSILIAMQIPFPENQSWDHPKSVLGISAGWLTLSSSALRGERTCSDLGRCAAACRCSTRQTEQLGCHWLTSAWQLGLLCQKLLTLPRLLGLQGSYRPKAYNRRNSRLHAAALATRDPLWHLQPKGEAWSCSLATEDPGRAGTWTAVRPSGWGQ